MAGLLAVDRFGWQWGRVLTKLGASTLFVLVSVSLGAVGSRYGQLVLAALLLSWLGDALLLSRRPAAFMAGLGTFLLAHVLFAAAFLSGQVSPAAIAAGLVAAAVVGSVILRWLLPHTPKDFKIPVSAYVVVVLAMCVAAAGHAVPHGRWNVLAGAVMFAASDISVARDRFVRQGYVNRLWGWPTYFVAQLLLAWSVAPAQ